MSRTRLGDYAVDKDRIGRWITEAAQAWCHVCKTYLTYFNYETEDNSELALKNLQKHKEASHDG